MRKFLNKCTGISLLIGVFSFQIFASRSSLAVEPQSTITSRSCSNLGSSLTKDAIELRGARLGFALDANTMGRAFQNFVNDSLDLIENIEPFSSPVRAAVTQNSSTGVQRNIVPDAVGSVIIVEFNSQGTVTYSALYDESYFYEVKFHRGSIYLSSFEHQIIGYIDVAIRSPAGVASSALGDRRPTPAVEFVTTSDTVIGLSVITKANEERVAIYQRIACDAPSTPSTTDMLVGRRVLLNPEVFQGSFPSTFRDSGRIAGLRR